MQPAPGHLSESAESAGAELDLSIVVVTRGPSLALARMLRSLGRARAAENAELILGLDASAPDQLELVERAAFRWFGARSTVVALPKAFPGGNRNALVARAAAPVIVFVDDDVIVPAGFLEGVRDALSDPAVGVAGGPNLTPPGSPAFEQLSGAVLASAVGTGPVRHRYAPRRPGRVGERSLTLCNLAVRRDLLSSSPFDPELQCAEENEFLLRLARNGVHMQYSPALAVYHHRRDRFSSYARQICKYGYGRGQLLTRAFYAKQTTYALPLLLLTLLAAGLVLAPYAAIAAVGIYLLVVAAAGLQIGGIRRGGSAAALIAVTHGGYAAGLLAGLGREAHSLQRRVLHASRGKFGHDAALTFVALGLAIGGGVAASVVIARALGPGGRGAFELVRTLSAVAAVSAGFGLGSAASKLRSRHLLSDAELFGVVCGSLITGAVVAVVAGLFAQFVGLLSPTEPSMWLMCASIPLITFYINSQFALHGLGREAWFRRSLGLRDTLFFLLVFAALSVKATIEVALLAWIAHWLVSAVVMAVLLYRRCGRPHIPARRRWRRLGMVGVTPLLLVLAVQAHLRGDVVVLDVVRGPSAVGHYAVAFGLAESVTYGAIALAIALFPRATATRRAVRTARSARTAFALTLVAASLLWLIGPRLITLLFGDNFTASGAPLRALLPGIVCLALFFVLASDLTGRGRMRTVAVVSVAGAAVNLGLNILLDARFGATGAAVASTITYGVSAAVVLVVFVEETGVPMVRCIVPRRRDARPVAAAFFGRRNDALVGRHNNTVARG